MAGPGPISRPLGPDAGPARRRALRARLSRLATRMLGLAEEAGCGLHIEIDVDKDANLTETRRRVIRTRLIDSVPESEMLVFSPKNPKYTVTVFTDIDCGYCRKLHSQIAEYNKQGIAVQYLAFPRMGLGSEDYRKMVSVWCADDRRKALTEAKNDHPPANRNCKNPVNMQYDIGRRVGLNGTPMILAPDGTELGGYVEPAKLRAALDQLAAGKAAAKSTAVDAAAGTGAGSK